MSNKKNRTKEEGKLDPYIQLVALEHANEKIAELELLLVHFKVALTESQARLLALENLNNDGI